jgi:hypothetical protein
VPGDENKLEIVTIMYDEFSDGDTIFIFNSSGSVIANFSYSGRAVAAGDVDGDGIDELAFGAENGDFGVIKYNAESLALEVLWQQHIGCAITDIEIADVILTEAGNEVIAMDGCVGTTTVIRNGLDGTFLDVQYYANGYELAIADVVGSEDVPDGFNDIIGTGAAMGLGVWDVYNAIADVLDYINGFAVWAGNVSGEATIFASNGVTLNRYRISGNDGIVLDNNIVDIDVVETTNRTIVVALTSTPRTIYGVDFDASEIVWQAEIGGYSPDYPRSLDLIKHGDVDLDGADEVVVGTSDGTIYVIDPSDGSTEFSFDTAEVGGGNAIENIDLADMNGDGTLDIVAEQDGSIFGTIIYMSPVAGAEEMEGVESETVRVESGWKVYLTTIIAANVTTPSTVEVIVSFVLPNNTNVDLAPVRITATEGLTVISGLTLPAGVTKSAQVVMTAGSDEVCVDDTEAAALSANCNAAGEVAVPCPGSASSFTCMLINATLFEVSGLAHTALGSFTPAPPPPSPAVAGGVGCMHAILNCTDWSACAPNGTQQRTCIRRSYSCRNETITETQNCTYVAPAAPAPTPPVSPMPICSNGVCESGEAETCPADCPAPSVEVPAPVQVPIEMLLIASIAIAVAIFMISVGHRTARRYATHRKHFHPWWRRP